MSRRYSCLTRHVVCFQCCSCWSVSGCSARRWTVTKAMSPTRSSSPSSAWCCVLRLGFYPPYRSGGPAPWQSQPASGRRRSPSVQLIRPMARLSSRLQFRWSCTHACSHTSVCACLYVCGCVRACMHASEDIVGTQNHADTVLVVRHGFCDNVSISRKSSTPTTTSTTIHYSSLHCVIFVISAVHVKELEIRWLEYACWLCSSHRCTLHYSVVCIFQLALVFK